MKYESFLVYYSPRRVLQCFMFIGRKYGKPYPSFPSQGFAHRCLLPVSNFGLVYTEGQSISSVYLVKKIFSTAEESNGESSSPSAPFSRSSPLASNFNYTLPIGRTDRGEGRRGGGRGQARGAWNEESGSMLGQHIKIMASIGADAPYIPIHGKGLRLISIASRYPSPGWKASASAHINACTHARIRAQREIRPTVCFDRYFCVVTSTATCPTVSARSRKNEPALLPSLFRLPPR